MTGNQLELRSIKAREEANSITKQYNEGVVALGNRNAAETQRHNEASEFISADVNRITENYNDWFRMWQEDYTHWEKEYKENALKLQYANEAQKRELEKEQLRLTGLMTQANVDKANADADYTRAMGLVNIDAQDLKERAQSWKEYMEGAMLDWNKLVDQANYQLNISTQSLNAAYKYADLVLANENLKIAQQDADTRAYNAVTNRIQAETQEYLVYTGQVPNLGASTEYLNSRTDLADSEKFRNYAGAVTSALGAVGDVLDNLKKSISTLQTNPIGFSNY